MNTRAVIASMFAAAVATPALLLAEGTPVKPPTDYKVEKCFGLAKAGQNDCSNKGNNSCGGTQKVNSDQKAYIYVPAGYCERIVGGSLVAAK